MKWLKYLRWTDAGLNWMVDPATHAVHVGPGLTSCVLSIKPIPGSEVPQPLRLHIFTNSIIEAAYVSGDTEIERPIGKCIELKIISPKLLPPDEIFVKLDCRDNGERIMVMEVRRAPHLGWWWA